MSLLIFAVHPTGAGGDIAASDREHPLRIIGFQLSHKCSP